jgi:hypothetical protein
MGGLVRPPSAVHPSGHTPLDDSGMVQDESLAVCEQRLTSGLPKPITAPCGSLTHLAVRSGTSAGTHPLPWVHPLAQPRGNLGVSDDPWRTPPRYSA